MLIRRRTSASTSGHPRGKNVLSLVPVSLAILAALCVVTGIVRAQGTIPETIDLKPGFVGVRYDVPLSRLLPDGAPRIVWNLVCTGHAAGDVDLSCPQGLRLSDQNLAVEPQPVDAMMDPNDPSKGNRTEPYVFEVSGRDGQGIQVRIRFTLQVRPLGVDESRFRNVSTSDRGPEKEDELRKIVLGFKSARPEPKPIPPKPSVPFVLVKSTSDEETLALTESFDDGFDPTTVIVEDTSNRANFVIQNSDVEPLIRGTIGTDATAKFEKGDYLMIHVVKWKVLKEEKSDPERELWALFEKIDKRTIDGREYEWLPHFAASEKGKIQDKRVYDTRIYGSKRVYVLPIHLNTPSTWDIKYKLTINQQVPTAIQDALQLGALIFGGGGPGTKDRQLAEAKDVWGARLMLFRYVASDMIVQVKAVTPTSDIALNEQSKDYSKKYDNEGRSWWDVSVGLPANSIKELEYTLDTSGQNNVVSVRKKERQNAYGFLNIFPRPVDLEAKSAFTTFHFVLGVPISGKPLDRPIVGIGSGIYRDLFKINFFAGVAFNKVREPRTLQPGGQATEGQLEADLVTRRKPKFVFGINFPVRQFISAIKGDPK